MIMEKVNATKVVGEDVDVGGRCVDLQGENNV